MSTSIEPISWQVGDELPTMVRTPSTVQLFRFSAVTWNPHRTHYDHPFARSEGHPGVIVHSHLHAALALQVVTSQLRSHHRVAEYTYRVVRSAFAGHPLTFRATVAGVDDERVQFDVTEHDEAGDLCLSGTVTVVSAA